MTYTPDPDDANEPTDAILAETAQAEFRALKGKVNTMVGLTTSGQSLPALYTTVANLTTLVNSNYVTLAASIAGLAPLLSPAFSGNPTGPTRPVPDNSNSLATTAWVVAMLLASPQTNTAAAGDISLEIANTTFVSNAITAAAITGAPFFKTVNLSGTYIPGICYMVDTSATVGLVFSVTATPNAQSTYEFDDPNGAWSTNPWTLNGNGNLFGSTKLPYTKVATLTIPATGRFKLQWQTAGNFWGLI